MMLNLFVFWSNNPISKYLLFLICPSLWPSAISVQSFSFPKYCQGTTTPCQIDAQCVSLCTYPYKETASEIPDHTKKVKVFIMMGQSNMVGFGQVNPTYTRGTLTHSIMQGKYSHLLDKDIFNETGWVERQDVQIVSRKGFFKNATNDEEIGPVNLKVNWKSEKFIGPEVQFGNVIGHAFDNPVLIIKVGTGNRALGWDFLPPRSERYSSKNGGDGLSYPGYGECPESSLEGSVKAEESDCDSCNGKTFYCDCPVFWTTKNECLSSCGVGWYAGLQFDEDLHNVKTILNSIEKYYPGYNDQGFEIGGFVFWQGFRDTLKKAHTTRYGINIERFIDALSESYHEYPGPKKFVHATIAFGGCYQYDKDEFDTGYSVEEEMVYDAQCTTNGEYSKKYEGIVKTVNARAYWRNETVSPRNVRHHYNHNADTYMDVGNALGWAMVDLLFETTEYVEVLCPNSNVGCTEYSPSASPSCMEKENNKFLLSYKRDDNGVILKTLKRRCRWLKKRKDEGKKNWKRLCRRKNGNGNFDPARIVCPVTCETCAG